MNYSYNIVDVFTESAFNGAQLAVFLEAEGLDDRQMQLIATELNLTETVFITGCGQASPCKLRIFSPSVERDFSGHATIAAGFVLAKSAYIKFSGKYEEVTVRQNAGLIKLVISQHGVAEFFIQFSRSAEAISDQFVPENSQLADMLSLEGRDITNLRYHTLLVSCEQPYLIIPLRSFEAVRNAVFSLRDWSTAVAPVSPANEILLFAAKSDLSGSNFHARLVGPQIGIDEDPPIASAMPSFAAYLSTHEHIKQGTYSFTIDCGTLATRKSVLTVELVSWRGKENEIRLGGPAVIVGEGSIIAP